MNAQPPVASARVLIVDDEMDHAEICAALLRRRGHKVVVARNGNDAISLAQMLHPDLVLLDVHMPGIDGWATAAALRQQDETKRVRIIFYSAAAHEAPKAAGMAMADGYLEKPFRAAELIACIERTLAS